jgi:hypothetical protein
VGIFHAMNLGGTMNLSRRTRFFWAIFLSFLMSNIPVLASAEAVEAKNTSTQNQMIPASIIVDQMNRAEQEAKVQRFLSRADVQSEFAKRGVSPAEASLRVASLSEQELAQLTNQMDQARAGGDVGGILVLVILVLLVVFLAKRV